MERDLVRSLCESSVRLSSEDESIMRWALSLARISQIPGKNPIDIGHSTDVYRERLHTLMLADGVKSVASIANLLQAELKELSSLFGSRLDVKALEDSISKRPFALVLGGGGGTGFVYAGAFAEFEEAGIVPDIIAGSSMGAILGAYRAKTIHFDVEDLKRVTLPLVWSRLTQSSDQGSRFGLPASFRLNLHDVFGAEFQKDGRAMHLRELAIPLLVTVAGIPESDVEKLGEADWLDAHQILPTEIKRQEKSIIQSLIKIAQKPLKAIYLGADELSREFDVIDAVGFSASVPGLFHYDVLRNDPHMVPLIREILHQNSVSRLLDGGLADNLPAKAARAQLQDPFVLSLDAFSPNWKRHWLFLPLMHIAAENSKEGYKHSDLVIAYQKVLSPINVVPSPQELDRAIENGRLETKPHIQFIKKMLTPIKNPFA